MMVACVELSVTLCLHNVYRLAVVGIYNRPGQLPGLPDYLE